MKNLTITLAFSIICLLSYAQAPQGFEYQAVVRDANSNLLVNQAVGVQISINQGSASGTSVYQETFSATTNLYGLVNLQIGTGTTGDNFSIIDWATGPYFVEIALDVTGGTTYSVMGASQLLSVPYALHARTVEIDNVDDADNDPTNEIELPSTANIGDLLTWDGSNWVASPQNGGKTYLILSGDLTDAEAVTKIANEVGPNTQFVTIQNTTSLTTVDLSGITELVDLKITSNSSLTSVLTPDLLTIFNDLYIGHNAITSINLPLLEKVYTHFSIESNSALTSLSLPVLSYSEYFNVLGNASLASLSLPALTSINYYFNVSGNGSLALLSIPVLTSSITFIVDGNNALSAVSLPAFTSCTEFFSISGNLILSAISLPALTTINNFFLTSNALPSAEINNILAELVAIVPTLAGKDINLSNQNPPAPPTGQGLIDKSTLISNGNSVVTD